MTHVGALQSTMPHLISLLLFLTQTNYLRASYIPSLIEKLHRDTLNTKHNDGYTDSCALVLRSVSILAVIRKSYNLSIYAARDILKY